MAPYASLVARALKLAMPLAALATGIALDDITTKIVQPEVRFMETLAQEFLKGKLDVPKQGGALQHGLSQAEGAGLRELQRLLLDVDPSRKWGGLSRVQNAAGDLLWVCADHYREYDPGLPVLPEPAG